MKLSILAQFSFFAFPIASQADSLIDTLKKNGAENFAKQIEANPDLLSYYTSSSVKTVFAVLDSNNTYINSTLRRRADPIQQAQIQTTDDISDFQTYNVKPGGIQETNLKTPKLKSPQVVVPETGVDQDEQYPQRRQIVDTNATVPSSPIKIASGLGKKVNLLRGNIAYDGGVIHIVDGEFAIPESLFSTLSSTNHTGFQGLLSQGNLSHTFTSKSDITIFTPSNEAIAAASSGNNTSPAALHTLLNNHVIPDFTGYLPALKDGATYKTLAGFDITITIKNDAYFVNGAKIIAANNILDSGVAHTIDGVLTPPPPPPFTGAGNQLLLTSVAMVGLAAILVGQVALVF